MTKPNFNSYAQRARIMSCANCRKPLPKCTICRRHYGSHIEAVSGAEAPSAIDHWFVWCCVSFKFDIECQVVCIQLRGESGRIGERLNGCWTFRFFSSAKCLLITRKNFRWHLTNKVQNVSGSKLWNRILCIKCGLVILDHPIKLAWAFKVFFNFENTFITVKIIFYQNEFSVRTSLANHRKLLAYHFSSA